MSIEKERKAFDAWHLKQFKDINCDLSDEDFTALYRRVYSHEAQDLIRQMEFNAWLSSANREGYKLVPVDATKDIVKKLESMTSSQPAYDGEDIYKVAIGEMDYYWKTGVKPMIGATK